MIESSPPTKNAAIQEIRKKVTLISLIVFFVILTLSVIIVYFYLSSSFDIPYIPNISIQYIFILTFLLGVIGFFLSYALSRQVIRIIEDYGMRLERILKITGDIRQELYGDILLEKIMDYALSITSSEAGSILLCNRDGSLVFKIIKGEKASSLEGVVIPQGKGIAGWVAKHNEIVKIEKATEDSRFSNEIDSAIGFETKSLLCLPLSTNSEVVGVLELLNKIGGHAYRERDVEIAKYLADQAAISILRTKFYEDQKNFEIHLTEILLEAMDFHLEEKRGHSRRVSRYCNIIARGLGMTDDEKKNLYISSLLHDVGFLRIRPDESFKKEEYIKHPTIGFEMIGQITFYEDIARFILYHHERYDGHGYPSGLKGEEIPLESRIICIAEAFDAMISSKSYRVPLNFSDAEAELKRSAGTHFDPELVEVFLCNISPQVIQE